MTPNKKRKYISLSMLILGILVLIILGLGRFIYGIQYATWQYLIVPFWIGLFLVTYRNFSQAVKEDDKYGTLK